MAKKLLILAAAIALPGGLLALAIAWIGSRPDVQDKLRAIWARVTKKPAAPPAAIALATYRVPVAKSRTANTVTFRPIRLAA